MNLGARGMVFPAPVWHGQGMRLRLRDLRKQRNWTQEELAARVGMNPATISLLENARQGWTHATLQIFAAVFEVPEHHVLGYAHPPERFDRQMNDLIDLVVAMSPEKRKALLAIAKVLAQEEHEEGGA